ncbi:MAG: AAA family ATPase, partial [Pirellulales bacterium]
LSVTQAAGDSFELSGQGREVDWLVLMRRLPAENSLDVVLREARLSSEDASEIADYLVEFYARLSPEPIAADAYQLALERHVRANGAALLNGQPAAQYLIRRIQTAQLRYLAVQSNLVASRAAAGRIVEGHGDLRPEHIYLNDRPAVIDCVEFSKELRTVDIADELSFLAMECQRLEDGGLGELVLATYQRNAGDKIPRSLLAFYRAYRACVRAKVVLLRGQQQAEGDGSSAGLFKQYMDVAVRAASELGPHALLIVGGLMGTGKSTLAEKLADAFGIEVLSTDRIRRAMLGVSQSQTDYGEGHYHPEVRRRIYHELFRRASELLSERQSLILDGTFLTREIRLRAYDAAQEYGAAAIYVQCTCPPQTAQRRIEARRKSDESESEARPELYDRQARDFEPPGTNEPAVTVNTTQPMPRQLQSVYAELSRQLFD